MEKINELRESVTKDFCIIDPTSLFRVLTKLSERFRLEYAEIVLSLIDNLNSVVHTVNTPFYAIKSSVINSTAKMIYNEGLVAANQANLEPEKTKLFLSGEEDLFEFALQSLDSKLKNPNHKLECFTEIYLQMSGLLNLEIFARANEELRRQAIVMLVGTLEVFFTDLFVQLLNSNPKTARNLLLDESLKKQFNNGKFDIEILNEHGFDLRGKLGLLIFKNRQVDSLEFLIKIVQIATGKEFKIKDKVVWKMFENRHLIVHRRGLARLNSDEESQKKSRLVPRPADVADAIHATAELARLVLDQLEHQFPLAKS